MNFKGIKNIIFDLGGVLLDIDPERTIRAFRDLGMADLIRPGGWSYDHQIFTLMEKGLLSEQQFREGIRSLLPGAATNLQIDLAWCAMLIRFPEEKIRMIRDLTATYRLYLFSNTNSIHIRYFQDMFSRQFGFPLRELFVKNYYSSEMHIRKPDQDAFLYVMKDAALTPAETLFIDDLDANTRAAEQIGIKTFRMQKGAELTDLFS
ncbi:MAG: HAD family hydrolase [Mangrovibacterium sp.]